MELWVHWRLQQSGEASWRRWPCGQPRGHIGADNTEASPGADEAPTQPAAQPGTVRQGTTSRGQRIVTGGILSEVALSLTGSMFPSFSSSAPGSALDLSSPCNKNCECQTDSFTPVCGADGITYLSACFAGCKSTVW